MEAFRKASQFFLKTNGDTWKLSDNQSDFVLKMSDLLNE